MHTTDEIVVLFFFFFRFFQIRERSALPCGLSRRVLSLERSLSRTTTTTTTTTTRETFDFSYARESVFPTNNSNNNNNNLYESAFISYVSLIICRVFFSSRSSRSRSCKNKDFAARMPRRAKKKSSEKEEERVGIVGFVWRKWRKNVDEE